MTACSAACLGQGPTTTLPFLSPLASPFLIFVVFAVVKTRRASKARSPTWSRSAGADGVIIDDVDAEVPHSAVLVVARELDGEAFE